MCGFQMRLIGVAAKSGTRGNRAADCQIRSRCPPGCAGFERGRGGIERGSEKRKRRTIGAQLSGARLKSHDLFRMESYCRRAVSVETEGATTEEVSRDTAPGGGVGAATPAV
jgi:hypothetical protein